MSPRTGTPSDEQIDHLADQLARHDVDSLAERLKALTARDRKGGHNGFNGYAAVARGSTVSDMPSGGGSDDTAVERLALGRKTIVDPLNEYAIEASQQLLATAVALDALAHTLGLVDNLTHADGGAQGCESCARTNDHRGNPRWVELAERLQRQDGTYTKTDMGGRIMEPMYLCDWCYQHTGKAGRLPSPRQVDQHHAGQLVRTRPTTTSARGHRL